MIMNSDLIEQFIDQPSLKALEKLLETEDIKEAQEAANQLASLFGDNKTFEKIADPNTDSEAKLISSFNNNLVLLIQKTWVEKSDEDLKAQVSYHLEELCTSLNAKAYNKAYPTFFTIVDNVVYLMFGIQTKSKDFEEYALRIDPEFGIFWWYMKNLPRTASWSEPKTRIAILLGMYFLANY